MADSAFCTSGIANEAARHGVWFVTRILDRNGEAAECIAQAQAHPEMLSHADLDDPSSPMAMWSGKGMIGSQEVLKLTVRNEKLEPRKRASVEKKARKEQEDLESRLGKLRTRPSKCKADAEKCVAELQDRLRLCRITGVEYEEVRGYPRRGRHKDGDPGIVKAVKVSAKVEIDDAAVEEQINKETYYVICTNDTSRKWTMLELLSVYKRQSVVERNWRFLKDRRVLVSAMCLQKPSRICALMWVLSLALLVYAATEWLMRRKMSEAGLSIPWTDGKRMQEQPTLMRLYTYMQNSAISLVVDTATGERGLTAIPPDIMDVLEAMGGGWTKYYRSETYAGSCR